jgi:hypothetical protein
MSVSCWFCESQLGLRPHERASDSAPFLNLNGTAQMICETCYQDEQDYRQRIEYEYARVEEERQRKRDAAEGW